MRSLRFLPAGVFAAAVLVAVVVLDPRPVPAAGSDLAVRGEYLVTIGGCNDCHSPKTMTPRGPEPDPALLLSGHPASLAVPEINPQVLGPGKWFLFNEHLTCAVGPWGASFAANLTSDKETGIGAWPEEMFIQAMRTGKHLGSGRPILPPMPWQNLALATDADLKAIFAYLKTVPAVKNAVPAPLPPDQLPMAKP